MRALPSGIFKILCSQRAVNLMHNPVKSTVKVANEKISRKLYTPEMKETVTLIKKYPPPVPWEEVTKALAEDNEDIKREKILKCCSELKDADTIMSFYKYVIEKGENLNQVNLFMIVKTMSDCPLAKILEHEELLLRLFKECKEFIMASHLYQTYAVRVFSHIPSCYRELLPLAKKYSETSTRELQCRAFDYDDSSTAWELLEGSDHILFKGILDSFTNYCIRQALENKFSIDLIQKLVNLCQRKGLIIHSSDIICSLQPLVNVLMHCQDEYIWSVRKCKVTNQMECLNCSTALNEVKLSTSEFKILKNAVFEALVPKKDVFLRTSHSELDSFKRFLNTCKPYDMVVDGLNFLYRGIQMYRKNVILHIFENYVRQKKRKVLVIARRHFWKEKLLKNLPDAQFFFTENSTEDDIFILLAALHGGLGTDILTSDFFGTYAAKLNAEMKTLFIKWQLYHQYIMDPVLGIVLPSRHVGLSQCTESPEAGGDSYKWHLTYIEKNTSLYSFRLKFDWVCLQAIPKKKVEQKMQKSIQNF